MTLKPNMYFLYNDDFYKTSSDCKLLYRYDVATRKWVKTEIELVLARSNLFKKELAIGDEILAFMNFYKEMVKTYKHKIAYFESEIRAHEARLKMFTKKLEYLKQENPEYTI